MRNTYWAVCYGHVCRWAEGYDKTEAMKYAYGCVSDKMTVVKFGTRSPKYASAKKKKEFLTQVEELHFKRTGEKIK